jgi:hypothetical protein
LLVRSFLKLSPGKAELVLAGRGTPDYERHLVAIAEGRADIRWQGFVTPKDFFRPMCWLFQAYGRILHPWSYWSA